ADDIFQRIETATSDPDLTNFWQMVLRAITVLCKVWACLGRLKLLAAPERLAAGLVTSPRQIRHRRITVPSGCLTADRSPSLPAAWNSCSARAGGDSSGRLAPLEGWWTDALRQGHRLLDTTSGGDGTAALAGIFV